MVNKNTLDLLVLATQQNIAVPAEARTTVTLLSKSIDALMLDVFLAYLKNNDAPLTVEDVSALIALQTHVAVNKDYILAPDQKEFISRLRTTLANWLIDTPVITEPIKKKVILIIEDEPQIRESLGKIVTREDRGEVLTAATGNQALILFRQHKPGLVLLDVSLPDMDGFQLLEDMKNIDGTARIYFVTGISGEAFKRKALDQGAAGYLNKPVETAALSAIIQSY
jgi:CheY-like chemotaxis protein